MSDNTDKPKWLRVNSAALCPICGRGDWCLVRDDWSAAICPRISEGAKKDLGEAGFLHVLDAADSESWHRDPVIVQPVKARIENASWRAGCEQYRSTLTPQVTSDAAKNLGMEADTMLAFGMGYDGQALTFPMVDAQGNVIGIHRRFPDGHKCAVPGSRLGLFCPSQQHEGSPLFIPEGLTDAMTAYELGLPAIGRASCAAGLEFLSIVCRGIDVVIVGDNDEPGRCGAGKIAKDIALVARSLRVIFPPTGVKDLRDWRRTGAKADGIRQKADGATPVSIQITFGGSHDQHR